MLVKLFQRRCLHRTLPNFASTSTCLELSPWSRFLSTQDGPPGPTVSIDRSGLFLGPEHSHLLAQTKEAETELTKQLKALIRVRQSPPTTVHSTDDPIVDGVATPFSTNFPLRIDAEQRHLSPDCCSSAADPLLWLSICL
jgi:hypothetical protein